VTTLDIFEIIFVFIVLAVGLIGFIKAALSDDKKDD
jgi:hypothetical protein